MHTANLRKHKYKRWIKPDLGVIYRYFIVGSAASLIYIILPTLALSMGIDKYDAIWFGVAGAAVLSYTAHVRYTYKVKGSVNILVKYLLLLVVNYFFFAGLINIISHVSDSQYLQLLIAGALAISASFVLNALLVFKKSLLFQPIQEETNNVH